MRSSYVLLNIDKSRFLRQLEDCVQRQMRLANRCNGGEPQPFSHLTDGFRFPCLGETIEVQISAIEGADC